MGRAALYWHTVRYLRPRQICNRLWRRVHRPRVRRLGELRVRHGRGSWTAPARREPSMTGPLAFRILGEARGITTLDWNPGDASHLWRYNLHYFDDLNAADSPARLPWHAQAIAGWITANPPGAALAWDPYPTSLRIVNWIKWSHAGNVLPRIAIDNLASQLDWLSQDLEFHLGGNHLLANAKALVFGGAFFEGPEARRWLVRGLEILDEELPRQVLADGGHFELSPMYHAIALEDVLDLVNLSRLHPDLHLPGARLEGIAARMLRWLDAMCHPDGEISFFNDAALGIAPSPDELRRYARDLLGALPRQTGTCELADSGYVRIERLDCVLLADVARVGPDELPGHAHADTLSFELSLFGERVIVNGGTSRYGDGEERVAERGTRAHSTVQIDSANSSEVWSGFRVARRAHPLDVRFREEGGQSILSAAHDGYRRLRGAPTHRREWVAGPGRLRVADRVEGSFREARARFHLKPEVRCDIDSRGSAGTLTLASGRVVRWSASGARARVVESRYAPRFGQSLATRCIELEIPRSGEATLELMW